MKFLTALVLLVLSGCTMMQPRENLPNNLADHCKDFKCVVDAVDSISNDPKYPGNRFEIMEGYQDTKLAPMLEDGRLTIEYMNPVLNATLLILGPMPAYTKLWFGKYGEMWKCEVNLTPWPTWDLLVHELTHCQGYGDRGPLNIFAGVGKYTQYQKEIMKSEGVERWVDTEFYKNKRYITDDYIWNNK